MYGLPMDRPRVMSAMRHNKHEQVPCLLGTGVDLFADHAVRILQGFILRVVSVYVP